MPPAIIGSNQTSPNLVEVQSGYTFQLKCLLKAGNPKPTFVWTKGRSQIITELVLFLKFNYIVI